MSTPNPEEKQPKVRKVEPVAEKAEMTIRAKARETWEHPTTKRFVRNTVKCGIIGTAYTAVDEVLSWGDDKPTR